MIIRLDGHSPPMASFFPSIMSTIMRLKRYLEGLANRMAEKSHGRGFMKIDIVDRIALAKKLKVARGTGVKQLARVLDIKESVLSSIMS